MTPAPAEPVVFAPRRLRVVGLGIAVALCALSVWGWFSLPSATRALFTISQVLTLLAALGVLILVIVGVAASSVRADAAGLRVRNGLRVHHVPWARVHRVVLRPGDAWAFLLLLPEGTRSVPDEYTADLDTQKRYLVGIQAHDGAYAQEAVAELRRRLAAAGTTGSRAT